MSAARWPDKVGLVCGTRRVTYAELDLLASRVARELAALGVRRGDRVVIHLDNSVEAVVSIFGILKAGAVFVVINPTTKAEKLAYILRNCGAAALVADARRHAVVWAAVSMAPDLPALLVTGEIPRLEREGMRVAALDAVLSAGSPAETQPPRVENARGIDVDLCALVYTSGSTGTPKGVTLTHLNVASAATSITTYLANTADDVILNVLPLSFDYGLYQVIMACKVGARLVLERSFTYPHEVLKTAIRERATGLPIVPTISAVLLRLDLGNYDLSSLRYITNTGAALPTSHVTELRRALPHVQLFSMYGLTECKRVAYLPPEEIDRRPTSVGKAMPNVEVYLVDDRGERVQAGQGELVVRGSNVMQGYWELPEDTDRVLRPGPLPGERVLHTGDIFRMDQEGYLYFVGRKDDIIKSRGEKISPKEVENVLYDLPGIVEAAVVGEPDAILGQMVTAYVALGEDVALTEQDVLHHCASKLEDFMVPHRVEFRVALPKTSTGKIDKQGLERRLAS